MTQFETTVVRVDQREIVNGDWHAVAEGVVAAKRAEGWSPVGVIESSGSDSIYFLFERIVVAEATNAKPAD